VLLFHWIDQRLGCVYVDMHKVFVPQAVIDR
jgi:hypothetical protein